MIGQAINTILTAYAPLTALVADKIFPHVIGVDTTMPAVVYTVKGVVPAYTKDGWYQDECSFTVTSYGDGYSDSQMVATNVRKALELNSGTFTGNAITKIYMTGQEELYHYESNIYITKLSFTTKINAYG